MQDSCGVQGSVPLRVINQLRGPARFELEQDGLIDGVHVRELDPGETFAVSICRRDSVVLRVFTTPDCGQALITQSEVAQVEGAQTLTVEPGGIFAPRCPADIA